MQRKLVAALACRAGGTRLYGKPLQNLEPGKTILDHIMEAVGKIDVIEEIVLGISEGVENAPFVDIAKKHGASYIFGSEKDVLWRLIQCGRAAAATDVFRITTECPFTAWELFPEVWRQHCENSNDITVTDFLPEGMHFEIYSLESLERSHRDGNDAERSEFCSAYPRRCPEKFKIGLVEPKDEWKRLDLRLTVDFPEDLVVCRDAYMALKEQSPHISTDDIIQWVDAHPDVHRLVEPYVVTDPLWAHVVSES